jgi:hypothetical protein
MRPVLLLKPKLPKAAAQCIHPQLLPLALPSAGGNALHHRLKLAEPMLCIYQLAALLGQFRQQARHSGLRVCLAVGCSCT